VAGAGRRRISVSSTAASTNVTMSTTASSAMPPSPATTPPIAAPTSRATSRTWAFSEFVVTSSSPAVTSVGSSACSAEAKNGARQLVAAITAQISHTWSGCRTKSSGTSTAPSSRLVTTMVRRRSHRSA
jgi:hypothetical protein